MTVARGIVRRASTGAACRDRRALEPDKRPQRERDGRQHAFSDAAFHAGQREVRGLECQRAGDADEEEGKDLERRRHKLHASRARASPTVDRRQEPYRPDSQRRRRHRVADDRWDERIEVSDEGDRQRRVRGPDRNPVAPRDEETREVSVGLARVGVRTAACRTERWRAAQRRAPGRPIPPPRSPSRPGSARGMPQATPATGRRPTRSCSP